MTSLSGYETIVERTLDGLTTISADSIDVTNLVVDGTTVNLADLFNKTTDDSDDIVEGIANLFLTPGERADIALNTAQRHAPVTLGTANGLSVGGVSGQELSLAAASATQDGALTSADWSTFAAKQDAITGGASSITTANLTTSRALVSDGAGKVAVSAVTATELGYLAGATSNIQAQLNAIGGSPWQEVVTPGGSFIRTFTTPATVEVNDRLAVLGGAYTTGSLGVGLSFVPSLYRLDVSGGARVQGSLTAEFTSITQNAANTRFIGTDHCYQEFYPRGVAAGRKAYIGFPVAGSNVLAIANQDTGQAIHLSGDVAIGTAAAPERRGLTVRTGAENAYVSLRTSTSSSSVFNATSGFDIVAEIGTNVGYIINRENAAIIFRTANANRMSIGNTGIVSQSNGDSSYTEYGPNSTWSSKLRVGACPDVGESTTAQVITTNGNLHLDAGRDNRNIYFNFYAGAATDDNDIYNASRATFNYNIPLGRSYEEPTPIRLIVYNYNEVSPVYYAPGVNFWGVLLPNIFQVVVDPLRASSRFLIRVKLSVALYNESSVAFRVTRTIGGGTVPINVGTGGINSGNSRMCGVGQNTGYWMVPPTYIEVLDHPNTTNQVIYRVEYMTYSTAYGIRLNLPNPGNNQGGDATAVTSTMVVEERSFAEYRQRVATNPP